mmetsp:Transcript_5062/g.6293  ORF Transcript_5062/g.6293 Transcript_5062/m.6293 type:complete len:185 (-) Transcript_5062:121-675(-)
MIRNVLNLLLVNHILVCVCNGYNYGYSVDIQLRQTVLDIYTDFINGIRDMIIDGDLITFRQRMKRLLTSDFIFPSDVTGITYNGLDQFLDKETGFGVGINGTFDSFTSIVGSNIKYEMNNYNKLTMLIHQESTFFRNECTPNETQTIIETEFNKVTFNRIWRYKWKISSYISQGGRIQILQCNL